MNVERGSAARVEPVTHEMSEQPSTPESKPTHQSSKTATAAKQYSKPTPSTDTVEAVDQAPKAAQPKLSYLKKM
jgi:hypothetical protein